MYWMILFLAPVAVLIAPWSIALWRKQWLLATCLLCIWGWAIAIMLTLWFGVGLILWLVLGLFVVLTTHVDLPEA